MQAPHPSSSESGAVRGRPRAHIRTHARARIRAVVAGCALAGLAFLTAAHATSLSELPLKVSALAKPNIIFGMDDSGSQDWEAVLGTDNGVVHWRGDGSGGSAWDSTNNRPWENSPDFRQLSYLFPLGTATGGALYTSSSEYGRAIAPIAQLAWTRSSAFNPLYYNPHVTYTPWSPAYVGGAQRTYSDAPANAAPVHPAVSGAQTINLGADWTSAHAEWETSSFRFRVYAGMALPAGTRVEASTTSSGICSGGTTRTLTATTVVGAGESCLASIPYYPATYWQRTVCPAGDTACVAAPDCTALDPLTNPGAACVAAPDGVGKLRRYEIKSGNTFPSGRTHAAELQNFANWFTYYRKRKLMLAASMGNALEPVTGMRLGVVPFNDRGTVTMLDADAAASASNRHAIAGRFYLNSMAANGTPTHATMKHIGTQFNDNTGIVQYACQRNSMFVVTDGFANAHSVTAPSYDSSTYGAGAPFTTTHDDSLADLALAYYTNRLRTDLPAGLVPLGDPARRNPITNRNLHVTTYGITLGARGKLYPTALNPFATDVFATPPTWPTPVADDPTMIDDLWHATVNGRGLMFLANDATAMRSAIQTAFDDILNQSGAQASIGVSSVNLGRGDDHAYLGTYNIRGWTGDLTRNAVNNRTGAISTTASWSAAALLAARSWGTRLVFSNSDGTTGADFTAATFGAAVNPDSATFTNTQVVEWMRGNRAGEGSTVRARASLLGAVVNAEPVISRPDSVVYLASGEGMLHAFDTATGAELWAYQPSETLASAGASVQRGWTFRTQLDATPTLAQFGSSLKMLVGGFGAAGRGYYALDVTNPRPANAAAAAAQFKWMFPAPADPTNRARMGYTVGQPVLAKVMVGTTLTNVVLVTSGYDNGQVLGGDGKGRLWMLNAADGSVIKTFVTADGSPVTAAAPTAQEAGLAHISALQEADGATRYAYGGDLLGNVWKFDLATANAGPHNATRVATLYDAAGNRQPVTAAPELVMMGTKRVILVGTGRVLDLADFGSSRVQTIYAIADDGAALANARNGLVQRVYSRTDDNGTVASTPVTGSAFSWASDRGWYMDLPAGEQANTMPVVTYGSVAFVTNKNGSSDCSQSSYLYLLDITSGKKVGGSTFVAEQISGSANSSRLVTLRAVDGKIFGTSHRTDGTLYQRQLPLGTTIPASKNAWRELRR
jgi:type IV pilus assembly protein PilY1